MRAPSRRRLPAVVLLAAFVAVLVVLVAASRSTVSAATGATSPRGNPPLSPGVGRCADARRGLVFYRLARARWYWQMGESMRVVRTVRLPCVHTRPLARRARHEARAARREFERWFEATYERFRCVHEHEGSWRDPDPTYFGGLQMDAAFEWAYGREYVRRWGHADRWPVWAQLVAGSRAHRVRGWAPWPNTARMCGLL